MKKLLGRLMQGCVAGLVVLPLLFFAGCTPQSDSDDDGPMAGVNDGGATAEDDGGDALTTTNPDEGTGSVEEGDATGGDETSELSTIRFTERDAPVPVIAIPVADSYVFMGSATDARSRTLVVGQSLPRQEVADAGIDLFGQMLYLTRDSEKDVGSVLQEMEQDLSQKPKEVELGKYTGFRFEEIDEQSGAVWGDAPGAYMVIPLQRQDGYLLAMFSAEATSEVYAILSSIEED